MGGEALVLQDLGVAQAESGDTAEARASLTEALRIFELIEDHEQTARTAALLASMGLGRREDEHGACRGQGSATSRRGGSPGPQ